MLLSQSTWLAYQARHHGIKGGLAVVDPTHPCNPEEAADRVHKRAPSGTAGDTGHEKAS